MKQEYFEKLKNPQWKSVHDAALADAEKAGADGFEAQIFAAVSADVHFARASEREEELEAVRLRLAARDAKHEAAQEQATGADPNFCWTAEEVAKGWAKANAKINAGR